MISGKVNRSYSVILLIEYHTASLSHLSCLLLMNHWSWIFSIATRTIASQCHKSQLIRCSGVGSALSATLTVDWLRSLDVCRQRRFWWLIHPLFGKIKRHRPWNFWIWVPKSEGIIDQELQADRIIILGAYVCQIESSFIRYFGDINIPNPTQQSLKGSAVATGSSINQTYDDLIEIFCVII